VLNFGAPVSGGGLGEAILPAAANLGTSANVTSSLGDVAINIVSNLPMERADNTTYAWDSSTSSWVYPTFANFGESINTFSGQFNAPSSNTPPPYGPNNYPYKFGDPLLGAVGSAEDSTQMILSFSHSIYGVAFEVSSASNPNFLGTLDAYDNSGVLLGEFEVDATGLGGVCSTLNNTAGPVPCNDAPTIQFYDLEERIASVVLTVNDNGGLFIDELSLATGAGAPEPESASLIGGGLIILALAAKRLSRARRVKESSSRV
jgi:hypothetical protein